MWRCGGGGGGRRLVGVKMKGGGVRVEGRRGDERMKGMRGGREQRW